jgi:acyl dehydratase
MRFADIRAGQVIVVGPASLSEADIIDFAQKWDPQWFHADPQRARDGRWSGLIASGWQSCAVAMKLAVDHVLAGSESFGSPGLGYVKWSAPVRPGDTLTLTITVQDARRSQGRPDLGVVRWRWELRNQHGATAVDLVATSLFDLGADERRTTATHTSR